MVHTEFEGHGAWESKFWTDKVRNFKLMLGPRAGWPQAALFKKGVADISY